MKVLCSVCPLTMEESSFRAHMRLHSEINSFNCEICNKKFPVLKNLLMHKKIHKNDLSVDCNMCDKKFSSKINLKKHILVTHEKVKFPCNFCNMEFASRYKCDEHMKGCHVNEKILNQSLKDLKMDQEKHFGGDCIQGNRLHKGYESIKRNDYMLTNVLKMNLK